MEIYGASKEGGYAAKWPALERAYTLCLQKTRSTEAVVCQLRQALSSVTCRGDAVMREVLTVFCRNLISALMQVSVNDEQVGQLETSNWALLFTL